MSEKKEVSKVKINKRMFNDNQIQDVNVLSDDNLSIQFSFASQTPYLRDFGYEIIDTQNMDLSRLNNKAPLLFNHEPDNYVGVINKAFYNPVDQRCYCVVTFDTNDDAQKIYNSVKSGILTHVSFGYTITAMTQVEDIENVPAYLVETLAFEASIVTIAADDSVGISRSLELKSEELEITIKDLNPEKETLKDEKKDEKTDENVDHTVIENQSKEKNEIIEKKDSEKVDFDNNICNNESIEKNKRGFTMSDEIKKNEESARVSEILSLAKNYKQSEMGLEAIEKGTSVNEFMRNLIDARSSSFSDSSRKSEELDKDMKKEGFSLGLALKSLASGSKNSIVENANREVEKKYNIERKSENSILIPIESLARRSVTVGNSASAGVLSETNRANFQIDSLFNNLAVAKAGAQILTDLTGTLEIPRFNNVINAQYVSEATAADDSNLAVDMVSLSPKTISANTLVSRNILKQTSMNIESIVSNQILQKILGMMDSEAIVGASKVKGLLSLDGIGSVTSGGTLTWKDIVALEGLVKSNNALLNGGSYLTNSSVESLMKSTQKGDGLGFILDQNGVNGYNLFTSNAYKTVTSSTDSDGKTTTSTINPLIFGDFSQMFIGNWGVVELVMDPYSRSSQGLTQITAFLDFDVAVAHPESFAVISDLTL